MGPPNPTIDPPDLPKNLAAFRRKYRREVIGRFYNGAAHLSFVIIGCLTVIGAAVSQVHGPIHFWEWATIPITFFLSNIVEFYGHRGPMHQKFKGMGLVFHRHVLEHHQFFTDRWMTCRSIRDFKIVLFPPVHLILFLGLVALPFGVLLFLLISRNGAWLYVATVTFYFMQYEALHFCYHLDDGSWVTNLPIMKMLRRHHQTHHNLELMDRYNFNITLPIADTLFGTRYRSPTQNKETIRQRVA
jgi:hypothetical protein